MTPTPQAQRRETTGRMPKSRSSADASPPDRVFTHTRCQRPQTDLHRALVGTGRGGRSRRGGGAPLGMQGLASKLIGAVLRSWTRLLDGHLCCSCCRSLFIWMHNTTMPSGYQPTSTSATRSVTFFQEGQRTLDALGQERQLARCSGCRKGRSWWADKGWSPQRAAAPGSSAAALCPPGRLRRERGSPGAAVRWKPAEASSRQARLSLTA